jgi:hypothetical protein
MALWPSETNTNLNLISWNIARRDDAWRRLLDTDADVALLQERPRLHPMSLPKSSSTESRGGPKVPTPTDRGARL